MSANGSKAGTDADGSGSEMDDDDDSSIMGVGAGMTGDATTTGTGRAFGAAGTGVGTNTFSESTEAMKRLLFLSDGKAQPNVPISNISAINSSLRIWYWCESRRSHYSCYEYVAARSLRSSTEAEVTMHFHTIELSYKIQPDQIISGNRLCLSH